ncbi:MAG: hypothetical protein LAP38_02470 [Acidobacteriia bacterium]|nr:hypothetical protein [Terriglobia bacterium]
MKPELQNLMEELQTAFNDSVCESDRIAAVLAEIKSVGYDVLLALEVTIGVTAVKPDAEVNETAQPVAVSANGEIQLTEDDEQFLRAMKIGVA